MRNKCEASAKQALAEVAKVLPELDFKALPSDVVGGLSAVGRRNWGPSGLRVAKATVA